MDSTLGVERVRRAGLVQASLRLNQMQGDGWLEIGCHPGENQVEGLKETQMLALARNRFPKRSAMRIVDGVAPPWPGSGSNGGECEE